MKVIVDMDDTLVATRDLNNDSYNYALEYYGYPRISNVLRINRNIIDVDKNKLEKIIEIKQKYFCEKWLSYRVFLNNILIDKLLYYGRDNCYLWTAATPNKTIKIIKEFELDKYFNKIIYDNKLNFDQSIKILKENTSDSRFLIYENNKDFFAGKNINIVDKICNDLFNVNGYLINCCH